MPIVSFERIVRPQVSPNIRPLSTRPALPGDDEDRGIATISGVGGQLINLTHSSSQRMSRNKRDTQYRIYDLVRVYDDNNPNRWHDYKITTYHRMLSPTGVPFEYRYAKPADGDFTGPWELLAEDQRETIPTSRLVSDFNIPSS